MSIELKVGDKVSGCANGAYFTGTIYSLHGVNRGTIKRGDRETGLGDPIPDYGNGWAFSGLEDYNLKLISDIKSSKKMTLFEKIALARKGEPEKTFIKAGITKMDGTFTTEGQSAFLNYLLEKNGAAFKTDVVDAILAEDEAKDAK